jgi:hypothetical protein
MPRRYIMPEDPINANLPAEPVEPATPAAPVEPAASPEPMPGDPEPSDKGNLGVALGQERDKTRALQAELEIMKQIAGDQVLFDANGQPVARPAAPAVTPDPSQPNVSAEMDKLWEDNPRKAVKMEIMSYGTWRDSLDSQVDKQELDASSKYQDYGKYRDTVRQYIRALPLDQRAKPGVIDLAYYVVKGQASGNVYDQAQQDLIKKIQAGEQVQGLTPGTQAAPAPVAGVKPTPDQAKAAEMMGMTTDEYMSNQVPGPAAAR